MRADIRLNSDTCPPIHFNIKSLAKQAISVETPNKPMDRPRIYSPIVTGKRIGAFQLGISVTTA
jgi:hypothetical protein